jgi:hypothetical protein
MGTGKVPISFWKGAIMLPQLQNPLLRLAIGSFFLAVSVGAGVAADAGEYHDRRGRLTIKASPDWTFSVDKDGDADVDCHSSDCKGMPESQSKRACFIIVRYAKDSRSAPRIDRFATEFLAHWSDGIAKRMGPIIKESTLARKALANGEWFTKSFDVDAAKLHEGVYTWEAWISGQNETGVVIYCIANREYWQPFPAYLEKLVSSMVWNAEGMEVPAAK